MLVPPPAQRNAEISLLPFSSTNFLFLAIRIQFDQLMSTAGASCMLVPPGRFLHYETLSIVLVIRFN